MSDEEKTHACNRCGEAGLKWEMTRAGWRLFKCGYLHICKEPAPVKTIDDVLKNDPEKVRQIRMNHNCSLQEASKKQLKERLTQALDMAANLDDIKKVMKVWLNTL